MEMDRGNGRKAEMSVSMPKPSCEVIAFPEKVKRDRYPDFPEDMVIAIDGFPEAAKRRSGEWLAQAFDCPLVDSGRLYRALVRGCQECRVNLASPIAVAQFCGRLTLRIRFERDSWHMQEAQVAVNDRWFLAEELEAVGEPTPRIPAYRSLREKVNEALRLCNCGGRVVVLGRDIGTSVFPETPYKFFLDKMNGVQDRRDLEGIPYDGAGDPGRYQDHRYRVTTWNGFKVLMIYESDDFDAGGIILAEAVLRATERGEYGSKRRGRTHR